MKMQDKELDELFRSNLDDLELKPSADVWAGINAGLEKGRRRKAYIQFLSIAASIIALFTVGLLLIPRKAGVRVSDPSQNQIVKVAAPNLKSVPKAVVVNNPQQIKISSPIVPRYKDKRTSGKNSGKPDDSTNNSVSVTVESNEQLASVNSNTTIKIAPVLSDEHARITGLQPISIKTPLTVEPQRTIAQVPIIDDKSSAAKPKHRPLSLGGIINAMVAKVDKRQDKIIEFTDDDGESSITGVNLGIIKIKKDQQTIEK